MEQNLNYLKDQLKYLGFGESLNDALKESITKGHDKFTLQFPSDREDSKATYSLNFSKSKQSDLYFFNSFEVQLEKDKNVLNHQFQVNGVKGVTAKEAINFLEGRSVKTEIDFKSKGKQEVFIALDKNELPKEITAETKLPVKYFNTNYGIDVSNILDNSPVKLANENYRNDALKALEKGNFVKVNYSSKGEEQSGLVSLNAQFRSLDYYSDKGVKLDYKELDKDFNLAKQESASQTR